MRPHTVAPKVGEGRNKLFHRFYEPLALLSALDPTQGDHLARKATDDSNSNETQLRRRFLDAVSYICDFNKGGDTTTAMVVAIGPLRYYVACNRNPKEKVFTFLKDIFIKLSLIYDQTPRERARTKEDILDQCVQHSFLRLRDYCKLLHGAIGKTQKLNTDLETKNNLTDLKRRIGACDGPFLDLCRTCELLLNSTDLDWLRKRAARTESQECGENLFAEVKHYIGRLAYHIKVVQTLVDTAIRIPALMEDPEFIAVSGPPPIRIPPSIRNGTNLNSIVGRMVSNDPDLVTDLRERLQDLSPILELEEKVRQLYVEKHFNPCVHAELVLLEFLHERRDEIELYDQDRFIGCSKPACFCCFMYIRYHPGDFVEPATHQKIYLNWLPPTSAYAIDNAGSEIARHELHMINVMKATICDRTIKNIKAKTPRRIRHHDSTTNDTFAMRRAKMGGKSKGMMPDGISVVSQINENNAELDELDDTLKALKFDAQCASLVEPDQDSDGGVGVNLV